MRIEPLTLSTKESALSKFMNFLNSSYKKKVYRHTLFQFFCMACKWHHDHVCWPAPGSQPAGLRLENNPLITQWDSKIILQSNTLVVLIEERVQPFSFLTIKKIETIFFYNGALLNHSVCSEHLILWILLNAAWGDSETFQQTPLS